MNLLDLFSGTGSVKRNAINMNFNVVSLDKYIDTENVSKLSCHIKCDILEWDYKIYPKGYFDIITASPVCLYWSNLRKCWIGRKIKSHGGAICTQELLDKDIEEKGKPMVDKIFEIIDYFEPKYWWIENPQTGRMKEYIVDKPFYDVDYCKYGFCYRKKTRIWTNILNFKPKICKYDCDYYLNNKSHKCVARDYSKLERYRIPNDLIIDLLQKCI